MLVPLPVQEQVLLQVLVPMLVPLQVQEGGVAVAATQLGPGPAAAAEDQPGAGF